MKNDIVKALWIGYSDDDSEQLYPFNIGDVINVKHDVLDDLWEVYHNNGKTVHYQSTDERDMICFLYPYQLAFPVKATRLAKKMYPNVPEKEGMLWIKKHNSN